MTEHYIILIMYFIFIDPCDRVDCGRGNCQVQRHVGICNCFRGYIFSDGKCVDIDECSAHPCHPTAT